MDIEFKEPALIHKYVNFEVGESIISSNCLRFGDPRKFNDPFDCDLTGVYFDLSETLDPRVQSDINELKKTSLKGFSNDSLASGYEQSVKSKRDNCAICCFSIDGDNFLMWSHYANNHNGVCLTFDNDLLPKKDRFLDVQILLAGAVGYDIQEKVNYCSNKSAGMQRVFLNKAKMWSYECEYRILTLQDEGIYHFNPLYLKKITFGFRVELAEIERIIRICYHLKLTHLKFYKTNSDGRTLIYEQLSPLTSKPPPRWITSLSQKPSPFKISK